MAKKVLNRKSMVNLPKSLLQEARKVVKNRWNYPEMASYGLQEQVLQEFLKKHKYNTNESEVLVKATLVNTFYSTHVAKLPVVVNNMMKIKDFDQRLNNGITSLVTDIAQTGVSKTWRSFATKYCALHNPTAFPIRDRIVSNYLAHLIAEGNLKNFNGNVKSVIQQMDDSYSYYIKVYDAFMQQYHLTSLGYRNVDWYLWVANKNRNILKHLDLFKLIK